MIENSICKRHSIMVNVASVQIYCEHFTIEAHAQIYEKPNMSGRGRITGKNPRSTKITYVGRVYRDNDPFYIARTLAAFNCADTFKTHYRGMIFNNCVISDFKIEDKGDDFIYLSLTVATSDFIDPNPGDTAS